MQRMFIVIAVGIVSLVLSLAILPLAYKEVLYEENYHENLAKEITIFNVCSKGIPRNTSIELINMCNYTVELIFSTPKIHRSIAISPSDIVRLRLLGTNITSIFDVWTKNYGCIKVYVHSLCMYRPFALLVLVSLILSILGCIFIAFGLMIYSLLRARSSIRGFGTDGT